MEKDLDFIELQKMVFIYNALKTGWSVKMKSNGKFVFTKDKTREIFLDDYLKNFIRYNLSIENLCNS